MNYRHIYHAGNFADVFKHIILTALIERLKMKDTSFFVLDTHAGIGLYDLNSIQAQKTLEANDGIKKFMPYRGSDSNIKKYIEIVSKYNIDDNVLIYPGSPVIISNLIRKQDRFIANELHEEDYKTLQINNTTLYRKFKILHLDAYQSLKANIPPKEKRGLILIDPPFEQNNEFDLIIENINLALKKWSSGIYMIWYPIKKNIELEDYNKKINNANFPKASICECLIKDPFLPNQLNGCGVLIINTPWQFTDNIDSFKKDFEQYLSIQKPLGITFKNLNF